MQWFKFLKDFRILDDLFAEVKLYTSEPVGNPIAFLKATDTKSGLLIGTSIKDRLLF